jgi:DNA (cytosine-5)-methyltransferase 1
MINVGSDFSGVGAFNQALDSLNIVYKTVFACDWDKYARQTYIHNYGKPDYYPSDVYDRKIPKESLDIYMTSPPCQAFSLAGKRKGEKDKRGVLFYNSHEFIVKNKPRYFIFENVKGLLSDDSGKTFNRWLDYLGGKSVNGNPVIFPLEDATPYHIYHKVLNAKNYGVPQNRERVFIVGIRDDSDNTFTWPKKQHLTKRLKDVLEDNVDKKYYLSDNNIEALMVYNERQVENNRGFSAKFRDIDNVETMDALKVGGGGKDDLIKVKSATKKGFEIANKGDSINLSQPKSKTRRGRVGKDVAQTLYTSCSQGIICKPVQIGQSNQTFAYKNNTLIGKQNQVAFTIRASQPNGVEVSKVMIGAIRGRNPENPLSREVGLPTEQRLELNLNGTSNALTTVQKDNVVVYGNLKGGKWDKTHEQSGRVYDINGIGATVHTMGGGNQEPKIYQDNVVVCEQRNDEGLRFFKDGVCGTIRTIADGGDKRVIRNQTIRRLTPRECFRLMDFSDIFKMPCSNSQMYKQAGNSIVVAVLAGVISKLNL